MLFSSNVAHTQGISVPFCLNPPARDQGFLYANCKKIYHGGHNCYSLNNLSRGCVDADAVVMVVLMKTEYPFFPNEQGVEI